MKIPRLALHLSRTRRRKIAGIASRSRPVLGGAIGALACVSLILGGGPAKASIVQWDADANSANNNQAALQGGLGGAGTWDTAALRWWNQPLNAPTGAADVAWNNANFDTALFAGTTGGTITLGAPIVAGGLTFLTGGYTTTLSAVNTLTLQAGAGAPILAANASATIGTAAVNGILGTQGFIKAGGGTLTVRGGTTPD